jgi:predicted porin
MKRKYLALLIAGLSAGAVYAADNIPTVYGKVNVTLNKYDFDGIANPTTSYTALDTWKLESNSSRLGVKGDYPIAEGLKAIYKLEYEVYTDSDKQGDNGSDFKQRNTYAGLQHTQWGTLFAGKNDTPLKATAAETVQLFKDMPLADFKYVMVGENRENNIIQYATPNLSGFIVSAQIEPGEDSGSKGAAGTTSTSHTNHGVADKYSAAVTYKQDSLYLALAGDHNVNNTNIVRAVGQYGIGPVLLGALWQSAERNYSTSNTGAPIGINSFASLPGDSNISPIPGTTTNPISHFIPTTTPATVYKSQDAFAVSAAWAIDSWWTVKGQYVASTSELDSNIDRSDTDAKNYALGVDYKLNSNAKVFAYYAAIDTEGDEARYDGTLTDKTFAVGWEFKF